MELPKRHVVYDPTRPADHLYLVLAGRVRITQIAESGTQTLLRIVSPEDFFGAGALIPGNHTSREAATVVEPAQVMSWRVEDLEQQIERDPNLGLAFLQTFGGHNQAMRDRLTVFALYKTGVRVALALLELGEACGKASPQGGRRLTGVTHQAIAEYVGTSREIVTCEMNRLRRLGYISYSRRFTDIQPGALMELLREQGITAGLPEAPAAIGAR
jgi:CRP/FNR family transcriptional regulator, cyclic AMP receptor protein